MQMDLTRSSKTVGDRSRRPASCRTRGPRVPWRVASGELDVESWLGSALETEALKREMKRVKGVGDYAAENLLKLVGRYDVLALDSWVRAKFIKTRGGGRACDDKKIARYYSRFDTWRGLALWCDMTRDWFD